MFWATYPEKLKVTLIAISAILISLVKNWYSVVSLTSKVDVGNPTILEKPFPQKIAVNRRREGGIESEGYKWERN